MVTEATLAASLYDEHAARRQMATDLVATKLKQWDRCQGKTTTLHRPLDHWLTSVVSTVEKSGAA